MEFQVDALDIEHNSPDLDNSSRQLNSLVIRVDTLPNTIPRRTGEVKVPRFKKKITIANGVISSAVNQLQKSLIVGWAVSSNALCKLLNLSAALPTLHELTKGSREQGIGNRESGTGNREKILCILLIRFVNLARLARQIYAMGFLFIVLMVGERLCF
ncbi:hypothetical protein BJP36_08165 [Moorena producens JHB]|uniref:Uncharacterized protein n=1 Tax=Moorena producens (strain JHB) TaxID=1454205 RepID=A0A1D9FX56_MOOP1|nr:hypothetical protein [Moorena producens]AOY79903.2 hypothetical protein BJP36_08165 [Moorena producens JHB]